MTRPDPRMKFLRSLLLPAALLAGGCHRSAESAAADAGPVLRVRVAAAVLARSAQTQAVPGTIRPFARALVAAKVTGTVATTRLVVGRAVAAGEELVTLQAGELAARLEQARAALAQADREFERERSLESQGVSTTDALRAADDRRRQARAAAEEAEAMLAYTRVTAPFAGVVTGEFAKPGDLATPGRALFSLEGADHLRAEVAVPESLGPLAIGAPVAIELDDAVVTGTLAELSPAADSATRTRLAEVDLPNQAPARSGQFVRVRWPAADDTTLTVPATALSQLGQMERVFVVAGGHAQLRLVKTGARVADRIQVVSGLDAGEPVILAPPATLRDGQAVESAP